MIPRTGRDPGEIHDYSRRRYVVRRYVGRGAPRPQVLSNVVSSQVSIHALFGGVVPEIASRKHVEVIDRMLGQALNEAGLTLRDIEILL